MRDISSHTSRYYHCTTLFNSETERNILNNTQFLIIPIDLLQYYN